jgi:hypothetical protein
MVIEATIALQGTDPLLVAKTTVLVESHRAILVTAKIKVQTLVTTIPAAIKVDDKYESR